MINLNFGLFWSGSKLSYLRYMTFKTLRHHHPESKIELYVASDFKKTGHNWNREKQDFEEDSQLTDCIGMLEDLNVDIIKIDKFKQYAPNYQSDWFRWWFLEENGGFYLDTDQIILKPFDTLPLDSKIIYSAYGNYTPVGVIGASKDSKVVEHINKVLPKHYNPNDYNSMGPWMFRAIMKEVDMAEGYNTHPNVFYPAAFSHMVEHIYNGSMILPRESYALHWFGGHPLSQDFNKKFSKDFAKGSRDTISKYLQKEGLLD